jgi:SSS family solute:Na+ symporter
LIPASPNPVAFLIIGIYLIATITVGYLLRGNAGSSAQFLHARRTLPTAVTAIAFLAVNCGALEIVGIVASTAKYGMLALHFYWIGAIPAMVFLALFMMPIYSRSRAMTVPDFLRIRYNEATQILSAVCLAAMMAFISGISLYAISAVLYTFFGWSFFHIVLVTSAVILWYVLTGGLKATIYNEVLQLALTIAGLVPLAYLVLRDYRGIQGLTQNLPYGMTHVWSALPLAQSQTATMDVISVVFGLGFVLSCGYWCTDFVLIQRALAARNINGSINTPLYAAIAKLFFPILVVVPGLAAATFFRRDGITTYNQALPALMQHYYGKGMLGLGISAILASLMSGLAGNINALSTLWTHDIYRAHIRRSEDDAHYVFVGRLSTVVATILSVATAYIALRYNNLMDYLQLLFSLFNAPLFATFLLGMFTTWATPGAGFWGLAIGMTAAIAHNLAVRLHLVTYGSDMIGNFYGAIYGWGTCGLATVMISAFTRAKSRDELQGVTYFTQAKELPGISVWSWALAGCVIAMCVALNVIFR